MKAALIIASLSLALAVIALFRTIGTNPAENDAIAPGTDQSSDLARVRASLESFATEIAAIKSSLGKRDDGPGEDAGTATINERLTSLESSLTKLQSSIDSIRVEPITDEIAALFLADDGVEKADAYFESGKFTIAADGYMKFLEAHPDHPDARDILAKAREAYQKAGYSDMAIWVQGETMRLFPENRPTDLMTLAGIEKLAGRYDDAIAHSAEAAELAADRQTEMWNRLYWAWYNQLRDGDAAGLQAYLKVQTEIQNAGLGDSKMAVRAQEKIDELRRQLAAGR